MAYHICLIRKVQLSRSLLALSSTEGKMTVVSQCGLMKPAVHHDVSYAEGDDEPRRCRPLFNFTSARVARCSPVARDTSSRIEVSPVSSVTIKNNV